jgi:HK97 family phage prohead protease
MQLEGGNLGNSRGTSAIMAATKKWTKIETRQFGPTVEIRRADPKEGTVVGYASTFGNRDLMDSVVVAGAFTNTLRELRSRGRSLPMLLSHDQGRPVGVWDELREDAHGLMARGRLDLNTQGGKEARSLLQSGAITGLSIGFLARENGSKWNKNERQLTDLDLLEVSLCPCRQIPRRALPRRVPWVADLTRSRNLLSG